MSTAARSRKGCVGKPRPTPDNAELYTEEQTHSAAGVRRRPGGCVSCRLVAPVHASIVRGRTEGLVGGCVARGLPEPVPVDTLPGCRAQPRNHPRRNCNAVFVQVRRRADVCYPSGGRAAFPSGLSPRPSMRCRRYVPRTAQPVATAHCRDGRDVATSPRSHDNALLAAIRRSRQLLDDAERHGEETADKAFDPATRSARSIYRCMDPS